MAPSHATDSPRHETRLDTGWQSVADDTDPQKYAGFEKPGFDDHAWQTVDVPHNWDDYGGSHRLIHGNRHGYAWYRREFALAAEERGRRIFLFFEGVGSYATVWVNGNPAGTHAGGRTTFTLDITDLVTFDAANVVAVRADHPAGITDLPWVCGGCSATPGFSEGSQPMGIFRPVTLVTTNQVRVEPFGVHVWNDADASEKAATVHFRIEIHNYGPERFLVIEQSLHDPDGVGISGVNSGRLLVASGASVVTGSIKVDTLDQCYLWSPKSPWRYFMDTQICDGDQVLDMVRTKFGIRTIHWPDTNSPTSAPLLLNGEPVFINGTCEYEHVLGASHAFSDEQIRARVAQIRATGFNAFRDAHQPHNLRYQEYWDRDGLLWWPQFAAQIWIDTPEFRANFKALLREWVRERRNSPSLVLWGLANESKLPADFAAECVALIRELDPTSPSQRLVTTCNSGKGTDWNVPQNWTGTYGGNPAEYADDLRRQRLIGEYGAWRSLGLHSEGGFIMEGERSEDRAAALLETKIRLGESVRAEVPGHFHWLFATHDNPGRTIGSKGQQGSDGWAELDRIGPANNKGLLTLWGEPTDAFYLYRANYAPAATDPMVYIVSHTWPDRWKEPGRKSGIIVYSNCDEVELFNDVRDRSLGVRHRGGPSTHFQWDDVEITSNVLYAEARVAGKTVATDAIVLKNLPEAPHRRALSGPVENLTAAAPGQNYLYRINCGGPDHNDTNGQLWLADRDFASGDSWYSESWAKDFPDVPARFGSQRENSEIIRGTNDQALFQTYRYGREKLHYRFAVPDGEYRVELYFAEPWYGTGGGDCTGWRLFDVALNGTTVLRDFDLWKEAGFARAVKKTFAARAKNGLLEISFPRVASYQAVISAIAISTTDMKARVPTRALTISNQPGTGVRSTPDQSQKTPPPTETTTYPATLAKKTATALTWTVQLGLGGNHDFSVRYTNRTQLPIKVVLSIFSTDGALAGSQELLLPPTKTDDTAQSSVANLGMNAGEYTVNIMSPDVGFLDIESLWVK